MVANNIDSLNINNGFDNSQYTASSLSQPAQSDKTENYVQEAEVDGIEILVNMAKQGKIDPWNVNIVDVTDKYLTHLFQSKAQNLRLTGRTLLFAAILLKLKSNVLEGLDVMDFEPQHDDDYQINDDEQLDYSQDDYIPTNKTVPSVEKYSTAENIKTELEEQITGDEPVLVTYEITSGDLKTYEKKGDYEKGKANPFSTYVETPSGEGSTGAGQTGANSIDANISSKDSNTFYKSTGTK